MRDFIKQIVLNYGVAIFIIAIAIVVIIIGIKSKRSFVKLVCYNLTAVFVALFIYEL